MAAKRAASTKAEPFRRALTAIAAGTVAIAVAFVLVQQDIRGAADEPQRWMASDAASRLDRGAAPADAGYIATLEGGGAFWHLVDLLWIVLFALFYLLD